MRRTRVKHATTEIVDREGDNKRVGGWAENGGRTENGGREGGAGWRAKRESMCAAAAAAAEEEEEVKPGWTFDWIVFQPENRNPF